MNKRLAKLRQIFWALSPNKQDTEAIIWGGQGFMSIWKPNLAIVSI